jgi:spore coat protein U-like protein
MRTPPGFRISIHWVLLLMALGGSSHALALSCLLATVSSTGPSFGTYTPDSIAANNSNGSVIVNCVVATALNGTTTATVSLSAGSAATFTPRTLLSGAHKLNYNLFIDPAYTQIWGDGTGSSLTVTDSFTFILTGGLIQSDTTTIYGQIPPLQLNVFPGSYSDTITVTVTY